MKTSKLSFPFKRTPPPKYARIIYRPQIGFSKTRRKFFSGERRVFFRRKIQEYDILCLGNPSRDHSGFLLHRFVCLTLIHQLQIEGWI